MKVLMISLDKSFFDEKKSDDVVERHHHYSVLINGNLDIIVLNKNKSFSVKHITDKLTVYPTNSFSVFSYVFSALKISRHLFNIYKLRKPYSLVVTQDPFITGLIGYLIKYKYKIPLLINCHGDFFGNSYWLKENKRNYLLLILAHFLIKRCDGIRVVNRLTKLKLIQDQKINSDKIEVIPMPVNLKLFQRQANPALKLKKFEKTIREIYLLFVGRLVKVKNIPLLLKAFKKILNNHPKVKLIIIGQGPQKRYCQKLAYSLSIYQHIEWIGWIPYKSLCNYYFKADIVILPSFSESFGRVLVEAGACGKPVVASMTTGAKEVIKNKKTGLLFPINDEESLVRALNYLIIHPEKRRKMGESAYHYIHSRFDYDKTIKQTIIFWQRIANLETE